MLSFLSNPILMQLPMAEAGQLLLVIGISFAIITLISSTARFHKMIQLGEDSLISVDDCNDFFFIQVTRYLSKINRASSGFMIFIIQFRSDKAELRPVQEQMLQGLKHIIREDCDKACLFREDCVAALIDTEDEKTEMMASRMASELQGLVDSLLNVSSFRAGVSSFPLHGQHSRLVIEAASEALERADFGSSQPILIATTPEIEFEGDAEQPDELGEISREDKNAALDTLTGVLKPAAVGSYFRKYLLEIRRKKGPAAVLCIGINRIDNIINLHGEDAADAVIAGVAKLIRQLTRNCDLIGRYHRDDFLVLTTCTLEQGEMIGLRIREAVQKETFRFEGKSMKTSIAIGITGHPEHGKNLRELFRGAYGALEIVRGWNTSSCLVYDPAQHAEKINHEQTS